MHQGVKRLDLRSYMNSRPCETLQLAQVDLLLQQNMPGLQDKKVQHPSQSECHFIMFPSSFWMFLKQMLMKFSWNGALLGCCPCQRVWIAVSLEIKVPRLVEPRFFLFWTPCQLVSQCRNDSREARQTTTTIIVGSIGWTHGPAWSHGCRAWDGAS